MTDQSPTRLLIMLAELTHTKAKDELEGMRKWANHPGRMWSMGWEARYKRSECQKRLPEAEAWFAKFDSLFIKAKSQVTDE